MRSSRWRLAALFTVVFLLSGCGLNLPLLPVAGEPPGDELSRWQHEELLEQSLKAVPEDIAENLPEEYIGQAARFLTRILETAPDGTSREWQSVGGEAALAVRLISTAANGETVCRDAVLSLETAETKQALEVRTCRLNNGLWTR